MWSFGNVLMFLVEEHEENKIAGAAANVEGESSLVDSSGDNKCIDSAVEDGPITEEHSNTGPIAGTDTYFNQLTEDDKLYKCFLYSLKKKIKPAQLPMLTSAFFRDCIQACW